VVVSGVVGLAGVGAAVWTSARSRDDGHRHDWEARIADRREQTYERLLRHAIHLSAAYKQPDPKNGVSGNGAASLEAIAAEVPRLHLYGSDRMQAAYEKWALAVNAYRTASETRADPLVVSVALEGIGKALNEMTKLAAQEIRVPTPPAGT